MLIYPKIFQTRKKSLLYFRVPKGKEQSLITIRIHGKEKYDIEHSKIYRIDEEERFPFLEMKKERDDLRSIEVIFDYEQKYDVKIAIDGEIAFYSSIFALDEDLYQLNPYKGDTHMHTNRSDGDLEPIDLACAMRKNGCDFIVVTDHHIYESSLETRDTISKLTKEFVVYPGEEIHNRHMGYFHIVGIGENASVNRVILENQDLVEEEVQKIIKANNYPKEVTPYVIAYRTFVSNKIREFGGLAVFAHPYWDAYGEYNIQKDDFIYVMKNHLYDAIELYSSSDSPQHESNGNNLTIALCRDLLKDGYDIPYLGASDTHKPIYGHGCYGKNFTMFFAKDLKLESFKEAVKDYRSVALFIYDDRFFQAQGQYRYVNYTRFLVYEYYPEYNKLCEEHSIALKEGVRIKEIEKKLIEYKKEFFGR